MINILPPPSKNPTVFLYFSSPSPDLKSGTLERAAPTAADPKEKLALTSVRGCSGDGSEVGFGIDFGLPKPELDSKRIYEGSPEPKNRLLGRSGRRCVPF